MKGKIILFVILAGLGIQGLMNAFAKNSKVDKFGFVPVAIPEGATANQVLVVGANCDSEIGIRTRALANRIAQFQIPYRQTDTIRFNSDSIDNWDDFQQASQVMKGEGPIVFINGKAKANPQVEEIVAEYKAMTGQK